MPAIPTSTQPIPTRLIDNGGRIFAEWADIADTDPTLPFLHDRIACSDTYWQEELPEASEASQPSALILHAGRCGSTLVSRSLSLISRCHVLSEPQALNDILSVDGVWPFLPRSEKIAALRRVAQALIQSARPKQDRVIMKLSSWNALHLSLLEEAFPDVPKLFIYRPPEEILVSLRDSPSGWMRRANAAVPAKLFLGGTTEPAVNNPLAFASQVLGRVFATIADAVASPGQAGKWLIVSYNNLPGAMGETIIPWLGLQPSEIEMEWIAQAAEIHAKSVNRTRRFVPDGARKQAAITPELGELSARYTYDAYHRLERLRAAEKVQ